MNNTVAQRILYKVRSASWALMFLERALMRDIKPADLRGVQAKVEQARGLLLESVEELARLDLEEGK